MSLQPLTPSGQQWNTLQEPAIPNRVSSAYLLLLSAIDQVWQVRQPVKMFYNWLTPGQPYYHITLERKPGRQQQVLSMPYSNEVEQYLAGEQFEIKIVR